MAGKTKKSQQELLLIIKSKYPDFEFYPDNKFSSINNILMGKCNIHNQTFTTSYNKILKYNPCKKCYSTKVVDFLTKDDEYINNKITEKYGDNFYELIDVNRDKKRPILKLKCVKHNYIFDKSYSSFIHQMQGCPICSKENRKSKRTPVEMVNELLELDKPYDYSKILMLKKVTTNTLLPIICPIHGEFKQTFHQHHKNNCPKCNNRNLNNNEKINKIPNNENFEFLIEEGFKATDKIKVRCIKHDIVFYQKYNDMQQGHVGCEKCNNNHNKINLELKDFIDSLNINVEYGNRIILSGKELDIYFPDHNLAIEYNGIYWHSNEWLNKPTYHKNKTDICEKNNIQLLHIWENDWKNNQEIIKSIIKDKLKLNKYKIYARKCDVRELKDNSCVKTFLNQNHLQGSVNSSIKLGLYYNNELVSVMTFGKLRKNLGQTHKEGHYELLRFCNKFNTSVVGGASKLFQYFIKNYNPLNIISYANRDISNGNLYDKIGMNFIKNTPPNYWYFINSKKLDRFSMRKHNLIKMGYDGNLSEKQIISQIPNIKTIYNSGNKKYEYSIK